MDGIHDLGGMDNFGPIETEENEPVFHADWERAIFSNVVALLGAGYFKVDEVRRATEEIPPVKYIQSQYYEKWLDSTLALLYEKNVVTPDEIEQGRSLSATGFTLPPLPKEGAEFVLNNPVPANVDVDVKANFNVGDAIVSKNMHPHHHTRIPRYVRGKRGVVEKDYGVFLLPDTNGHSGPDKPQHVYSVRFMARELWGDDASPKDSLYIDLFDDYMEHA